MAKNLGGNMIKYLEKVKEIITFSGSIISNLIHRKNKRPYIYVCNYYNTDRQVKQEINRLKNALGHRI